MSESQFLLAVEATLGQLETVIEAAGLDVDCARTALILTIEFDAGARIVVNAQAPMRQLWLAWRGGAQHFAADGGRWQDTRSGEEFFAAVSRAASALSGTPVVLQPGQ